MQRATVLTLALCGTLAAASRFRHGSRLVAVKASDGHPVEKVMKLLKDLSADVTKSQHDEEYAYTKYHKWCEDNSKTLSKAIETGKGRIDSLTDKVSSLEKQETSLGGSITELEKEIQKHEVAGGEAKTAREGERSLWEEADKDLEDTISAIAEAIGELESAESSTTELVQSQAVGKLLQMPLLLAQTTSGQQELLMRMVRTVAAPAPAARPDLLAGGDATAHEKTYTFKSGNVTELLKQLKAKFEDDRVEATKAETNAANAYELSDDARSKAIDAAKSAKTEKETILGDVQQELAAAKGDLKGFKEDLKSDEDSLAASQEACSLKANEYAERSALRTKEQEAMAKAIEILAKVSGVRAPPAAGSEAGATGFLQMPPQESSSRDRAINLLREEARRSHSQAFGEFAEQVASATGGPFDEVNQMIQKMIFRLMAEQTDEDEHKAWCDTELEKVNISETDKKEKIESLDVKIQDGKAKVALMSADIEDADDMVAKLQEHMKEAGEIRAADAAENKASIKDAQDAQSAIAQATAVLEAHYKESGMMKKEDWEFLQREPVTVPEEPSTWDSSYTGIADPQNQPDGIISMLKEISADFAKMEADTMASEAMDQKAYEEEMKKSEIESAKRTKESEMKADEKKRLLDKIGAHEQSLKHTGAELEAVQQYAKDLSPACLQGGSTYEQRKASRAMEIEALKEAQVILEEGQTPRSRSAAPAPAPAAFLSEEMPPRRLGIRARVAQELKSLRGVEAEPPSPGSGVHVVANRGHASNTENARDTQKEQKKHEAANSPKVAQSPVVAKRRHASNKTQAEKPIHAAIP